ncbi:hypothetical protein PGT21_003729 [Puccinia graminis f. sp. tritici]|uniref:Uncharacterized protein n=1 Tax=Puccinia graminis f. sp. tritici TaxID=56615 RepID=A0A5B0SHH0_PUCGR|nr:hypothetical protein PGT21_003729 [Puccinia graminis f. sp. tritici]KAA1136919.1 hypothetical protein PGTUg99_004452 [Puccinia graminis f. sp. tritici]
MKPPDVAPRGSDMQLSVVRLEDPRQRILDEAEANVHRRGIDVSNEPDRLRCEFVESTTKKSSVRGTDDELSPYRGLTELISSVPRIGRVSSVPQPRAVRTAPGV